MPQPWSTETWRQACPVRDDVLSGSVVDAAVAKQLTYIGVDVQSFRTC